ncbi:MAG TPA: TIGR03435 family protein [Terriglobia bacterium]
MNSIFRCCLIAVTLAGTTYAQNKTRPEFEVASVKPSDTSDLRNSYMPTLDVRPGAELRISNRRLDEIIMVAYGIGGNQLSGPQWLTELTTDPTQVARFEIIAKVPEGATKDQVPLMLQNLLEDRFKLKVHRESRPTQVYSLDVSRNGHKLTPSVSDGRRPAGCARSIGTGETYSAAADCYSISMAQLAQQLPALAPAYFREGPVVDHTGLTGSFDIRLEWRRLDELQNGASGKTIIEAVKDLGLDLEKKRENAEVLIVDHCERMPTEN